MTAWVSVCADTTFTDSSGAGGSTLSCPRFIPAVRGISISRFNALVGASSPLNSIFPERPEMREIGCLTKRCSSKSSKTGDGSFGRYDFVT